MRGDNHPGVAFLGLELTGSAGGCQGALVDRCPGDDLGYLAVPRIAADCSS